MNVMHVILTLEQGGAQEVVRLLCQHVPPGWRVPIVASFEDGPVRAQLERLGVRVEILGKRRYGIEALPRFLLEGASIRRRLRALAEEGQIDLVQTHLLETLDFHVLALLSPAHPRGVVWTIHNVAFLPDGSTPWLWLKQLGHRALYRLGAGRVSAIVAVSHSVKAAFVAAVGPVGERVTVLPNGVDLARLQVAPDRAGLLAELGLAEPVTLALTVGRLAEQKGHSTLIAAAVELAERHSALHWLWVGDGPLGTMLAAEVRRANLASRVHFLGLRADIPTLLCACDLFVLPSLWEGLSVALLEAMAAARPIVASAAGGTLEALGPGETGLTFAPGDARALAGAITRTLDEPAAARERGLRARERVREHFSVEAQVRSCTQLYDSLLGSRGSRP